MCEVFMESVHLKQYLCLCLQLSSDLRMCFSFPRFVHIVSQFCFIAVSISPALHSLCCPLARSKGGSLHLSSSSSSSSSLIFGFLTHVSLLCYFSDAYLFACPPLSLQTKCRVSRER